MSKSGEKELFRRLRFRLTLVCTLATGVILVAMAGSALTVSQGQIMAMGNSAFQSEVNAIFYHLNSQTVVDHTWLAQTEAGGDLFLYLELSGRPLAYGGGEAVRAALVEQARTQALEEFGFDLSVPPTSRYQAEQESFSFWNDGGERFRVTAARIPQEKGWIGILILGSMAGEEAELFHQRLAFGGFVAAALALLGIFAWFFTRRALCPIEESRKRQTEFIAAASHELRSPLAVIRTCLSALRGAEPEQAEHFTAMAEGECVRMSRLVGDMLSLANADSGAWTMCPVSVEPETLLLETAERFEGAAREKGVYISVEIPVEPLPRCIWDGSRVEQLLTVLLDNGISYTPVGGRIELSLERVGDRVRFMVSDSGPGIPDGEKERIFERFYRSDSARTDREHYGLGLCVAREIAQLHGGALRVTDASGGGAAFLVELPLKA